VHQLLRGGPPLKATPVINAASLLTETTREIELHDFDVISRIPETTWSDAASLASTSDIPEGRVLEYAKWGLLVCDNPDPELADLKRRDDLLRDVRWNQYAQQSHFMTKWSDSMLADSRKKWYEREMPSSFSEFEKQFGAAPPALPPAPENLAEIELPLIQRSENLFQLLKNRRTTRSFNCRKRLSLSDLSVILYYCFGVHGYKKMSKTHTVLKKTSPSGGALHPIEIYPLVSRAEGLDAGIYHYNMSQHALELLKRIPQSDIQDVTFRALAEQEGLSKANVIFILVARFGRHFWKYRSHQKAYKVIAMDAAHLSQTHYLVCTELGLGAYVTAAVNDKYIEELIGLDGVNDGVIAVCGAGIPCAHDPQKLNYKTFVPRQTKLTD